MTTSRKTAVESALEAPISDAIPAGVLAYICSRNRNRYFDYIHEKLREAEDAGLTRNQLARRINKSASRLSHILSNPGNWTLDTASELLVGICKEELVPGSEPILGKPRSNFSSDDAFEEDAGRAPTEPYKFEIWSSAQESKVEPRYETA